MSQASQPPPVFWFFNSGGVPSCPETLMNACPPYLLAQRYSLDQSKDTRSVAVKNLYFCIFRELGARRNSVEVSQPTLRRDEGIVAAEQHEIGRASCRER